MLNAIPPKVASMAEIRSFEKFWQELAGFEVPVLESRVFLLDFKLGWLVIFRSIIGFTLISRMHSMNLTKQPQGFKTSTLII